MSDEKFTVDARVIEVIKADQGILDYFGMQVAQAHDGMCLLKASVPSALINAAGFAHGSICYSMLDTACAYALASKALRGVTIHGNITYLAAAKAGDQLEAQVNLLSHTRRTASLRGECYIVSGDHRKLAAHGSYGFQLIEPRD